MIFAELAQASPACILFYTIIAPAIFLVLAIAKGAYEK